MISLKEGTPTWDMFGKIDSKLMLVFAEAYDWLRNEGVSSITVTSIIRPQTTDSGVHAAGRGIDVSIQGIPRSLLLPLQEYINNTFPYDHERPLMQTCVLHVGGGYAKDQAEHLHFQVCGH